MTTAKKEALINKMIHIIIQPQTSTSDFSTQLRMKDIIDMVGNICSLLKSSVLKYPGLKKFRVEKNQG